MDAETRARLLALYAELDAVIARHQPRCDLSGKCCRFTEYGQRLYLTEPEAALLLEVPPATDKGANAASPDHCPYQQNGLCTARERRPTGCRVFFCDPAYQDAMVEIAEQTIRRLKRLHEELDRPWRYQQLHHFVEEFWQKPA